MPSAASKHVKSWREGLVYASFLALEEVANPVSLFFAAVQSRRTSIHAPSAMQVLEATSNEPWGPHGTLMSDIASATRNFNDYQLIMSILWKRLNDTGKDWRHVYKSLTVLEFLVAQGAERVIDELREHQYQIQVSGWRRGICSHLVEQHVRPLRPSAAGVPF